MDKHEEMRRWIALVVQNAANESSAQIHKDIETFLGVSNQLAGVLSARSEALRRKIRPRTSCPIKSSSSAAAPQAKRQDARSNADGVVDSSKAQNRAGGRSQGLVGGDQGNAQKQQSAQQRSKTPRTQPAQQKTTREIDQRSQQIARLRKTSSGAQRA